MTAAIRSAESGRPAVAWVEGDAGMGKTTLIRHVVDDLPPGTQLLRVVADEMAAHVSFDLAHRLGSRSSEPLGVAMEILESWALRQDDGPLVVVVEDLHWADGDSIKALLAAVQRLDEDRVAVVVSSRSGLQDDGWERFCRDAQRCQVLRLGPFDAEEVAVAASSAGVELSPYQAERLRAHTGGHPLYVRTLLAELSADELRGADGDLPAPRSLRSAVTARLSEIPAAARSLAAALAVLNRRTALPLVGRVAGVEAPIDPLEHLLETGFVHWDPAEPGPPIEFTHPLYRQAVYEDLSPILRRDLHLAAAKVSNSAASLSHRVAAADGTNDALAEELEVTARHELERGLKAAAGRTFQWASSLSLDPVERERRLVAAAVAYVDAGQLARAEALRGEIETIRESPERSLVLGLLEWAKGEAGQARSWLQRVVDSPDRVGLESGEITARAWAELAEIHITLAQAPEAAQAAAHALVLASPHTAAERLARGMGAMAEAHRRGATAGLATLSQRLPEVPDDVRGDDVGLLVMRATLAWYAGRARAALADLRACLALAQRGFVPVELARCHRELASVLAHLGHLDEGLVQARTALSIAADDRRGTEVASCHAVLGTIMAHRGDLDAADTHIAAANESAARMGAFEGMALARVSAAAAAAAHGQPGTVIALLDPMAAEAPMIASLTFWPTLVVALVEAGQLDRAHESVESLDEKASARGLRMAGRILGLRARITAARGDLDWADELFVQATDAFGPDDPFLERVMLQRAHGLLSLRRDARDQGTVMLRDALQQLASVGALAYARQVELDLEVEVGPPRSGRRSARGSLELTDREHDVAVLVAKGYSNPEVAAELYVSRKAIEYHLGNIYGKLGITSRRELRGRAGLEARTL